MGAILVCKKNQSYEVFFKLLVDDYKEIFIGNSDRIPILFSYDNWENYLILQNGNETQMYSYKDRLISRKMNLPRLAPNHSSAFIDIDGDLKAELILITQEKDKKAINIMQQVQNGYEIKEKILIPQITGPVVFADFDASGANDIAYISLENKEYFLNILYNCRNKLKGASKNKAKSNHSDHSKYMDRLFQTNNSKFFYRKRLNLFQNLQPMLQANDFLHNLPYGIIVSDINLDSYPDLLLTFKDANNTQYVRVLLNKKDKDDKHYFEPLQIQPNDLSGILSASFVDLKGERKQGLVINRINNGIPVIQYIESNISKDYYKLFAITMSPQTKKDEYQGYVPGISYKLHNDETNMVRIGNQMSQSSFLHLQPPSVVFGLGSINYLIDNFYIGGPPSSQMNQIYEVGTKILPNSYLVCKPHNKGVHVELYISLAQYAYNIAYVFCLVLFLNCLFVIYSYRRDKLREKTAKKKESHLYNFSAL